MPPTFGKSSSIDTRLGDVVEGKIVRLTNFGAFVEIEEGIEGLLHVSELDEERVEKPEDKLKVGESHRMKIIKITEDERKIGLSIRAVDMEDYESHMSSQGSPDATLGDFADLSSMVSRQSGIRRMTRTPRIRRRMTMKMKMKMKMRPDSPR